MPQYRKQIGAKLRFQILTRDRFRCSYCGKTASHTELRIDHITPVSKGGTNDLWNLTTACFPCNSGKSDMVIPDGAPPPLRIGDEDIECKLFGELAWVQCVRDECKSMLERHFCDEFSGASLPGDDLELLLLFLYERGPVVFDWMTLTAKQGFHAQNDRMKYICGLRRNWV